jgi:hypothetical protein
MDKKDESGIGNPFYSGLVILAHIIARLYRWELILSSLSIPSFGAQAYSGYQNYFEWSITGEDGNSYLITATVGC